VSLLAAPTKDKWTALKLRDQTALLEKMNRYHWHYQRRILSMNFNCRQRIYASLPNPRDTEDAWDAGLAGHSFDGGAVHT
jgi:hypothetical protein